jgi:hypothetical protein
MVVLAGMYSGGWRSGKTLLFVQSDAGSTHGAPRVSRELRGTGGKRRRVSFITALTAKDWYSGTSLT